MEKNKKNLFVVLEGIDGSGKTELVKMLVNFFSRKYSVIATSEPTDQKYGRQIRDILRKEKSPKENSDKLIELFIKDREYHLSNVIEPFLAKTDQGVSIVFCDRYYYSTIAFQSSQGINIEEIISKNKVFRKPDITFILDVEPSIALQRIHYRKKEKFEQLDFMNEVRACFLKLPDLLDDNIKIIDSSKSIKDAFKEIKKELDLMLKLN